MNTLELRFKNLYWSRLVSLQNFRAEEHERHLMLPDIKEDMQLLAEMQAAEDDGWRLYFEPKAFKRRMRE